MSLCIHTPIKKTMKLQSVLQKVESKIHQLEKSIEKYKNKKENYNRLRYLETFEFYLLEDEYYLETFKYFKDVLNSQILSDEPDINYLIKYHLTELNLIDLPSTNSAYSKNITNQWKTKAYQEFLEYLLDLVDIN